MFYTFSLWYNSHAVYLVREIAFFSLYLISEKFPPVLKKEGTYETYIAAADAVPGVAARRLSSSRHGGVRRRRCAGTGRYGRGPWAVVPRAAIPAAAEQPASMAIREEEGRWLISEKALQEYGLYKADAKKGTYWLRLRRQRMDPSYGRICRRRYACLRGKVTAKRV